MPQHHDSNPFASPGVSDEQEQPFRFRFVAGAFTGVVGGLLVFCSIDLFLMHLTPVRGENIAILIAGLVMIASSVLFCFDKTAAATAVFLAAVLLIMTAISVQM